MWSAWLLHGRVVQIYIGNLNNFFSDGSYIAEPTRCQSRERLVRIAVLLLLTRAMRRISWNILLQEGDERFDPHVAGAGAISDSQSEPTVRGAEVQSTRGYCFRFADVFLPAGPFAEGFLAADFAAADFIRVRAAGFRFGLGFACAALPAFPPAMPPTTAPTAAPSGPKSDPSAAPAATPPAIPKFEVVSADFISAFLVFAISRPP